MKQLSIVFFSLLIVVNVLAEERSDIQTTSHDVNGGLPGWPAYGGSSKG